MGDRRQGERREPQKGMVVIPFKDAVLYIVVAFVLILSLSINIVLCSLNTRYRAIIEEYENDESYYEDDDEYDYTEEIEENEQDNSIME